MKNILIGIALAIILSLTVGCSLNSGETRKITAWGIWTVVAGNPLGVGYWHSERGPGDDIKSEQSAKPSLKEIR